MSKFCIQRVIGKAVVSQQFRAGLLNGSRAKLLREFDLTLGEFHELMQIQATTLEEFAAAVDQLIETSAAVASRSPERPDHAQPVHHTWDDRPWTTIPRRAAHPLRADEERIQTRLNDLINSSRLKIPA